MPPEWQANDVDTARKVSCSREYIGITMIFLVLLWFVVATVLARPQLQQQQSVSSSTTNPQQHCQHDNHLDQQRHGKRDSLPMPVAALSSDGGDAAPRDLADYRRVCYLRTDARTGLTSLSQVDGSLCSHLILAFATLDASGRLVPLDDSGQLERLLAEVGAFKRQHPRVKVMVSVCNSAPSNGFSRLALDKLARQKFARSAIEFIQRHQLDGLDLDWEFPNFPHLNPLNLGGHEFERTGLTKICQELRSLIVEDFFARQVRCQSRASRNSSGDPSVSSMSNGLTPSVDGLCAAGYVEPYVLTVAVAAQEAVLRASYELRQLANLCDWLNIMSYDYYLFKPYTPFTGPNAPLYPIVDAYVPVLNKLSFCSTINRLLLVDSIEPDKIVMGVPMYARAYRLLFRHSRPASFALAYGSRGGARVDDYLDYREVRELAKQPAAVEEFDERARVPYLLADEGTTWVSFENERSLREKVQTIKQFGLAGYMTWNLNSDDFEDASYPLHRVLLDELAKGASSAKPASRET